MQSARLARLYGTTVGEALDAYDEHQRQRTKDVSRIELLRRLRLFFAAEADTQVSRLRADACTRLYAAFTVGRSVDYHRNTLGNARGFLDWCVERGWLPTNPIAAVKGVGKRSAGKLQLTGDEARAFLATAISMAEHDDAGALGAAMLLLMGLRQGEVRDRQVRDLDLDGTVLRVQHGKTARARRTVAIPTALQPLLADLAEERGALEPLFAAADGGHHTKAWMIAAVKRVCVAAGVPVVCPHGLRGTHASVAASVGMSPEVVASALGHEDARTTLRHYAEGQAVAEGAQARALAVIQGGRR